MGAPRLNCSNTSRMVCLIISIFIVTFIVDIVRNDRYSSKGSLLPSSLAFWEDNRTLETRRPLPSPIITTDKVNLTNLTLVITACCRNVEKHLIDFQNNIRAIGGLFKNYRLYLGESDSRDGTLKFIQEWAKSDPNHVDVYTARNQRWRVFFRTQRLAHCRNHLLERARAGTSSFDYYLVVDVDVVSSSKFTVDGFLSNFIYPLPSWAIMTASQTDFYYDLWALRTWPTMPFDYIEHVRQTSFLSMARQSTLDRLFSMHQKGIPVDHPLIEVESAFGGAAIYNAQYLSGKCVYNGWMDHGLWLFREQCEHVTFNQCVRQNAGGGKVFINPRFLTAWNG